MQDPKPKPSIVEGLTKFYNQYDPEKVPTEQQLSAKATEFAGREGELWTGLITQYTGSPPPDEHVSKLVDGFENMMVPDQKKKSGPMVPVLAMPLLWRKLLHWKTWLKTIFKTS